MQDPFATARLSLRDIARRAALPFFLFSAVLTVLLLLSWFLLIPELTRIDIGGSEKGISALKEYKTELEARIINLEQKRSVFLQTSENEEYATIKAMKHNRFRFQSLRSAVRLAVSRIGRGSPDVVSISSFSFNGATGVAELRGRIHNVGPRSMTVLAQFVEELDRIPEVIDIESSRYTREETDDHAFFSPFTIRLTIR